MAIRTGHFCRLSGPVGGLLAALAFVPCGMAADTDGQAVYLHVDAVMFGREMVSFSMDGDRANVILGDFAMTVGERSLSGRDAVIWIKESRVGQQVLRDVEVFIKGDRDRPAKVVEPDGTTTTDVALFVTFHHQGALRARVGRHGGRDVGSLPVLQEAMETRKAFKTGAPPVSPETPETPETPTTTKPVPPVRPERIREYLPVYFRAEEVSSEEILDSMTPGAKLRVSIAKGDVYISQGNPDSDLFLEIRADAAVVYSTPQRARDEAEAAIPEKIVGAYMEGDVVMRRGERTVRGNRLFYDFVLGRAIILEPVLRTIQTQRNIPVYIRAKEGRQTAAREDPKNQDLRLRGYEWQFRDALVTSSDFYTPQYAIAARRVRLEDATFYDATGQPVSERHWRSQLFSTTLELESVPLLWWPYTVGDAEEGHTALRSVEFGHYGDFGWGVESKWYLFRLLGVPSPEGFKGRLDADSYERGHLLGTKVEYERPAYSGYARAYGMIDNEAEDDFGTERKNIRAQRERGWLLWRHKQFLPADWQLQTELSYMCDRNFIEEFFPGTYWADKEQETLLYARNQRDNWAVTVLGQWRINDFLTQVESLPDVAGYLVGQSLWDDRLTLYSEGRLGVVRYRLDDASKAPGSESVVRADTRQEIDFPFQVGPVKVLPFAVGRATYWQDSPIDGGLVRPWGQIGVEASTDIWRIYNDVESRLWDLHRIKHVVTPYGGAFFSCTDVEPDRVYPFSPEVERYVRRLGGGTVGVRQLWQTKRGPAERMHTSDWLRLDVSASFFDDADTLLPADGRYFLYRPEYSLPRNAVNGDLTWHISDSTTFLADANYDVDSGGLGRLNAGIAVSRVPRLRYYLGLRKIRDADSSVGIFELRYEISRKYSVSFREKYDFDLQSGRNQATSISLVRKFARLYAAFTFAYDATQQDVGMFISVWPEGVPEMRIGGARMSLLQGSDDRD